MTPEEILESNAGDIGPCDSDYVKGAKAKIQKKISRREKIKEESEYIEEDEECPKCGKEDCICGMDESEDLYTAQEIEEVLRDLSPDELEYVKIVIDDNIEDFCGEFQTAYDKSIDIEGLIKIAQMCCPEDLELLGDCVFYVLDDIDDFSDFAYGDGELGERLINPQHIRKLKLLKRKATWKAGARKRARFRKTGEGRIMKRKAKLYMKRYRRRKAARMKRYGKEYNKFTQTAHFAK